jgi:hypothetical protein
MIAGALSSDRNPESDLATLAVRIQGVATAATDDT